MRIRLAELSEITRLVQISKAAFDTDVSVGASEAGGPPYYDDEGWHAQMLEQGHLYSILTGDALIGGLILFRDPNSTNVMYLGRVFIAPEQHRKGYGLESMRLMEEMFEDIDTYYLDTPIWNARTNRFYTKLGYSEARRDAEFIYYKKELKR